MNERFAETGHTFSTYSQSRTQPKALYDETGENLLGWVFELEPEGFVVVTADDCLTPVIAYAEYGSFPYEEHPDNILLNMLRQDLALRLKTLPLIDEEVIERNHRQWEGLIAGYPAFLDPGDSWPPAGQTWTGGWIETVWHQSAPYNDRCPIDPIDEVRCYTGCPATAMAQIINFWQYPDSVIFTESDSYVSNYLGRSIPIDAPEASMSSIDYNDGSPTSETAAELSYACGVATKSVYSSQGSGVFTNSVCADALKDHFDFSSAEFRDSDGGDFYEIMEQNVKDSMPAIIVIIWSFKPGGHTLICDGFREPAGGGEPEWHLYFGYGATQPDPVASAWYVIPDELPYDFDIVHEGILNIGAPRRPLEVLEENVSGRPNSITCFPNPALREMRVEFTVPQSSRVSLKVFDVSGQLVNTLVNESLTEGYHFMVWDGKDVYGNQLPSGCYFINLETSNRSFTQRIVLVR